MRTCLNNWTGPRPLGRRSALLGAGALIAAALTAACGVAGGADDDTPLIVATTGHIHDALLHLTEGVPVELRLLCGSGVDPHSFAATARDVIDMQRAEVIVYNGFHLEAQLGELLEEGPLSDRSWAMAGGFPAARVLEWVEDGDVDPGAPNDPHIWNHLQGWSEAVEALAFHLAELFPEHAERIANQGATYVAEIRTADEWARGVLGALPVERRVLVSGHDAFNYFAVAYEFETHAVLGVGNDPEADIRTMQTVAQVCADKEVPVIFLESITDPKVTRALEEACRGRGWSTRIADEPLHSDDLGENPPVDTYLGAFRMNVELIARGLGGASR